MNTSVNKEIEGIPANTTVLTDDITRVLNHADTFGVFNRWGNILPGNKQLHGIYYMGNRHLSNYQLLINGRQPVLLNSELEEEFETLNVHMVNYEFPTQGGELIPQGALYIKRSLRMQNGHFEESIHLRNYGIKNLRFNFELFISCDFLDLFEIRGFQRDERGQLMDPEVLDSGMRYEYMGLDQIRRVTEFNTDLTPDQKNANRLAYTLNLSPGESVDIECSMNFRYGKEEESDNNRAELKPLHMPGINSDNQQFNHWVNRSKTDLFALIARTKHGYYPYAGIPWFNTAFGRDGIITALSVLWLMPALARDVLKFLAATQAKEEDPYSEAQPGKILHEQRNSEMANTGEVPFRQNYGSMDATPLFVYLAGQYFRRTGDEQMLQELWPAIELAMSWLENYGDLDGDGFFEYHKKNKKGLANQGWKDADDAVSHASGDLAQSPIALCEVQAYAFAAYREASFLSGFLKKDDLHEQWLKRAEKLKVEFNRDFWDEELGTFVLALDHKNDPCRVVASNAGHALAFGIAERDRARQVANSLMGKSMYSGWGIRTLAENEKRYSPVAYHNGTVWPHDNAIISLGLAQYGRVSEANRIFQGLFEASLKVEDQRLPELFCGFDRIEKQGPVLYPVACSPQAWSVASVFLMLKASLNVSVNAITKTIRFCRPMLPEFLDRLRIRQIPVSDGGRVSIEVIKYPNNTGINILKNDSDWKIEVEK